MRLLLDTHVFLWCAKDDPRLTKEARLKIALSDEIYVSAASLWEVAIKINIKKIDINLDELIEAPSKMGFLELPITARHTAVLGSLPNIHRDPFDRMLIAQALSEPLTLLTADRLLEKYSDLVEVI